MITTQVLLIIAAIWVLIGVTASLVMGRRGHSSYTWLLLGALLGPLVVPIGISFARAERRDPRAQARFMEEGEQGSEFRGEAPTAAASARMPAT